ncbi:hypothetical protein [Pseudothermotoga sp.]|uniref:hypothetical protein n=1 Tax=Pseudothermotoga sp. TaxID=2033661 RepID=UPI0031F6931D
MKVKRNILLIIVTALAALLIYSCSTPIAFPKNGMPLNIVEAGPVRDSRLEDLSNWCNSRTDTILLWYPSSAMFNNRGIEGVTSTDKYVFLNNRQVGSYDDDDSENLRKIKNQIEQMIKNTEDFGGNLKLLLMPNDLFGTTRDLVIGVGTQEKVLITPDSGYVLVQFINENGVYRVTNAEFETDWKNLTVPKNIPSSQLKGFAFFKIENGEVVAALVIQP